MNTAGWGIGRDLGTGSCRENRFPEKEAGWGRRRGRGFAWLAALWMIDCSGLTLSCWCAGPTNVDWLLAEWGLWPEVWSRVAGILSVSSEQCFSNWSKPQSEPPGGLMKPGRWLRPGFWFSRFGWGSRIWVSHQFPGDLSSSPDTPLWGPWR